MWIRRFNRYFQTVFQNLESIYTLIKNVFEFQFLCILVTYRILCGFYLIHSSEYVVISHWRLITNEKSISIWLLIIWILCFVFLLSENEFIFIFKNTLIGYRIVNCHLFSFSILKKSFHFLPLLLLRNQVPVIPLLL